MLGVAVACGSSSTGNTTGAASSSSSSSSSGSEECFYAKTCRKGGCDGPITKSGCNVECGADEVEELTCRNDAAAGSDAEVDGDAGRVCTETCFRAITCRKGGCGGPITSVGCCSCLPDEVDDIVCADASD